MPRRVTKGMLAAAQAELENIHELAEDSNDPSAYYRFHAPASNRHMATLIAAGQPLPKWLVKNWRHLKFCGWYCPQAALPA